jgi:malonyl-CoA O-methyltransferase
MPSSDKAKMVRDFSRCALLYDRYANVQFRVADALLAELSRSAWRSGESIFEIGCGTGYYTRLLRERYGTARLKACDISARMIEVARKKLPDEAIEFLVADAETLILNERFDLVTSNAALQWFEDLEGGLKHCRNALNDGGLLAFSIFGPETFRELDHCLRLALAGAEGGGLARPPPGGLIRSRRFLEKERIAEMLHASFGRVTVRDATIREEYPSLRALLEKIRCTGARGGGLPGGSLAPPRLLGRVEKLFEAEFGRVEATYQAFLFLAER